MSLLKPFKAWLIVLDDGALCAHVDGRLDVFDDASIAQKNAERLKQYGCKAIRVDIREVPKKKRKA